MTREHRRAWRGSSVALAILAAAVLLLGWTSVGSAQTMSDSPILTPEHLWMANIADEAARRAQLAFQGCIWRAAREYKGQREAVDQVQKACAEELTNALDARTAALWIRHRSRTPDMFMPTERAKEHAELVDQIRRSVAGR